MIRKLRWDIKQPTIAELVDNLPAGNINRPNALKIRISPIIKPSIAPKI